MNSKRHLTYEELSKRLEDEDIRFIVRTRFLFPLWVLLVLPLFFLSLLGLALFISSLPTVIRIGWAIIGFCQLIFWIYILIARGPIYVGTAKNLITVKGNRMNHTPWSDLTQKIKRSKMFKLNTITFSYNEGAQSKNKKYISLVGVDNLNEIYEKSKMLISKKD